MVLRRRIKKPTSRRKSTAESQLRLMTELFQKAKNKKQETKRNLPENMKSKTRMNINPDIDAELAAIENEPKGQTNVVTLKASAGESRKMKKKQKEAGGGAFTVALTGLKPSLPQIQEHKDDSSGLDDNKETKEAGDDKSTVPMTGLVSSHELNLDESDDEIQMTYVQEDGDYPPFEFSADEAGNIFSFSYSVLSLIMNGSLVQPLFVWSNA